MWELDKVADEVLEDRAKKYDGGKVTRDDYWRYYGASAMIMEIYRKTLTLISLDQSGQQEKMLNELPDIINYSRFLWEYIKQYEHK